MKTFVLEREQLIKAPLKEVWQFFSLPDNLDVITPKDLDLKIVECPDVQEIYPGMLIRYTVRPLLRLPFSWTTEIRAVKPLQSFTDVQIKGPYRKWEHQHTFIPINDCVLMKDRVLYAIPFDAVSGLINKWIVEKKLDQIFDYRKEVINKLFKN
ncbi:MAG: SRPBCC family protein [Candidatus Dadabacteria bacterium]